VADECELLAMDSSEVVLLLRFIPADGTSGSVFICRLIWITVGSFAGFLPRFCGRATGLALALRLRCCFTGTQSVARLATGKLIGTCFGAGRVPSIPERRWLCTLQRASVCSTSKTGA